MTTAEEKHIRCASHPQALEMLAELVDVPFDPDRYTIILTPDRYTLGVERALFRDRSALNCEVLTLSRLCRRVLPHRTALSREGAVMLVSRAVSAVKDKLRFYGNAVKYYDFARDVLQTLLQMSASCVEPSEVKATGATKVKFDDLALIKAEYERLKAGAGDASDRLKDLIAEASKSELIKKSDVYAIGYADPTRLNRDAFAAIARAARSFTLFTVPRTAQIERKDNTELYAAYDVISQYKEVAARIKDIAYAGGRYGDVSVVCPEPRALTRILTEYGVEVYAETTTPLDRTPPLSALSLLYRLNKSGSADDMIALTKNPFSGCDRADAEKLQNYLSERGITRGALTVNIKDEAACRARDGAKKLVEEFRAHGNFADACRAVAEYADFEGTAKRLLGDETDMLAPVYEILDLLGAYCDGDFDGCAEAFFSAARVAEVKSLPRTADCVSVCNASSLRMTRCKYLFVVDFNEGMLPAVTLDTGLVSDAELKATGGDIEPTAREKNIRDRAELAAVVNNAEHVFFSYCTANGGKSSMLSDAECVELDGMKEGYRLYGTDDPQAIARAACTVAAARELISRGATKHASSLREAVGDADGTPAFTPVADGVECRSLSASELSAWFCCPYKRFLTYSVGLTERKSGKLGAPDFGIIVHAFMQKFINAYIADGTLDCSAARIKSLVDEALLELDIDVFGEDDRIAYERILSDARDYAEDNKTVIEKSEFKPKFTERSFKNKLLLGKSAVPLNGIIDRIDVCEGMARIIDYKTGSREFKLKSCRNGTDMQLPLYAAAVDDLDAVGFFYMPMRPAFGAKSALLDGAFVKDVAIAEKLDTGLAADAPVVKAHLTKDGTAFKNPSETVMEREKLRELVDACVATAGLAADELCSGYIAQSPSENACTYCKYGGLCANKIARQSE